MAKNISLSSIFRETKGALASSLAGLVLPKDVQEVQTRIAKYLNDVCDEDNEFRQNLTQSEDYILQAALSMLNAQRDMVATFSSVPKIETTVKEAVESDSAPDTHRKSIRDTSIPVTNAFLGGGGGALIGKLALGGWGAVFGAVAGTALVLYLAQLKPKATASGSQLSKPFKSTVEPKVTDVPVDADALLNVVGQLCESLDNLIATFRAQIQRVINKYESQEKPTIEREYRVLLEGIQSLIGYKRGHNTTEEKYLSKLQERIEDVAELLDNYGLEAVDYTADHADWFEAVESKNATEIKMVTPAIVKDGGPVLKGKIFIPKTI